jgi:uncharacterized protein YjbI with pentapeptide repeats
MHFATVQFPAWRASFARCPSTPSSCLCDRPAGAPLADTQAALSVLLGIPRAARPQLDLTGVNLTAVRANGADFTGALLRRASLAGAKLSDTVFDKANICGETDLRGACFRRARFHGAYIGLVDALAADFSGADFSGMRQPPALGGAITD